MSFRRLYMFYMFVTIWTTSFRGFSMSFYVFSASSPIYFIRTSNFHFVYEKPNTKWYKNIFIILLFVESECSRHTAKLLNVDADADLDLWWIGIYLRANVWWIVTPKKCTFLFLFIYVVVLLTLHKSHIQYIHNKFFFSFFLSFCFICVSVASVGCCFRLFSFFRFYFIIFAFHSIKLWFGAWMLFVWEKYLPLFPSLSFTCWRYCESTESAPI